METRANFVLIGSFTLAVIAAAFGFVLWFQSLHTTKARSPLRIVFEGPAAGLRNGGSVNFNGIRVGEVMSVKLDNPRRVVALAMVENNAPIRKDTLVGLEFQGLTGVAAIRPSTSRSRFATTSSRAGNSISAFRFSLFAFPATSSSSTIRQRKSGNSPSVSS